MNISRKPPVVSIGVLSLITIFTILLITSFAIIIFLSAQSDSKLSNMSATAISEFYEADVKAEEKYAEVYDIFQSPLTYEEMISKLEENGFIVSPNYYSDGIVVSYDVPINSKKVLYVEIGISENKLNLDRLAWQSRSIVF